mmetsp:Transcript_7121/g.12755  ORF Transcript_7121/g.12755 Transcript_7121/m.12755 type:complete len:409 (+) Transcript_7121:73-1299(+)|eukprot:CAMPEP_0197708872 /NCGR_PEP_ID=MMETSP1338-20131121/128172_1 /TAXON_ID=43686 ORGANISM="Pelagodinium beii, Strain RCC1491" /NCGR_SAMPLE_ID=MMETSP1338 /ASSEMBLY_ACC=CAM_ASM_000754 /LENGTH=408 /DNA_ID=CAMNT_0043292803 /DNA_START=68 /DNA_END=1294 /DNA_ORIENTATION=-
MAPGAEGDFKEPKRTSNAVIDQEHAPKKRKASNTALERRNKVVVRVPGTTANLGPGFDAVGMAVDIWNEISVERSHKFQITTEGEGASRITTEVGPDGASSHIVMRALRTAFEYAGEVPMPPVRVHCRNMVPVCSGFGSSSAAIVGGLIAGLVLSGKELRVRSDDGIDPEELLQLANKMEGHPDNVAPAIYGGIQLSLVFNKDLDLDVHQDVMSRRVPIPAGMRLVAYVPSEEARFGGGSEKTVMMRGLLQPMVPRSEAVFNIQRTALLVDAFHRGDLKILRHATRDQLHQPIRGEKAYPHLNTMMKAALDAGAHGAYLSGAGPTVMTICSGASGDIFAQKSEERQEKAVTEAMRKAVVSLDPSQVKAWGQGDYYIVSPTEKGAHVTLAEPAFSDAKLATFGSLDGRL